MGLNHLSDASGQHMGLCLGDGAALLWSWPCPAGPMCFFGCGRGCPRDAMAKRSSQPRWGPGSPERHQDHQHCSLPSPPTPTLMQGWHQHGAQGCSGAAEGVRLNQRLLWLQPVLFEPSSPSCRYALWPATAEHQQGTSDTHQKQVGGVANRVHHLSPGITLPPPATAENSSRPHSRSLAASAAITAC